MRKLSRGAVVVAAYLALAAVSTGVDFQGAQSQAAFLAPGVALGCLTLWGTGLWPAVLVGELALEALRGSPAVPGLANAAGHAALAVLGAVLLTRMRVRPDLARPRHALGLLAVVALVQVPLLGALVLATGTLGADTGPEGWPLGWAGWALASAVGLCVASAAILTWGSPARPAAASDQECLVWVAMAAILPSLVLALPGDPATVQAVAFAVTYPIIAGGADRTGPRGASLALLVMSATTVTAALLGLGQLQAGADLHSSIVQIDLFLAGATLIGLPLAALSARARQLRADLRSANRSLEELSATDELTELSNRREFDSVLSQEWNRALRSGGSIGLLMVDIDHFKDYNDAYGHQAGDACLRQVAEILANRARRSGELAARYGGEEFGVVVPGVEDPGLAALAEAVRGDVEAAGIPHPTTPTGSVTVSVGAATLHPTRSHAPSDLIGVADQALYRAKREGRNRVALHV